MSPFVSSQSKKFVFLTILVTILLNEVNCKCKLSFSTICDNLLDIKNETEFPRWTELIVGNETVPANPLQNYSLRDLIGFKKLVSLTVIGQINRLLPLQGRCQYENNLQILTFFKNDLRIIETNSIPNLKLKKISLRNNNIEHIEQVPIDLIDSYIEIMDLSDNKLEAIEKDVFDTVGKVLTIRNNKITHIQEDSLPKTLEVLNLDVNKLRFIQNETFKNLRKLEELTLSHNRLYTIPDITKLKKLRYLDLSYNSISHLTDMTFYNLTRLEFVDLSSNKIQEARFNYFPFSNKYALLSLGFNLLTDFSFENIQRKEFSRLELFLYGNPFNCDNFNNIQKSMITLKIQQNACDKKFQSEGKTPYCLDYKNIFYLDVPETTKEFLNLINNNKKLIDCKLVPRDYLTNTRVQCVL